MIHKGSSCDDVLCQLLKVVYLCGEQQFNICPASCLGPCTQSCPDVLFLWQLCGQTKLMSSNTYNYYSVAPLDEEWLPPFQPPPLKNNNNKTQKSNKTHDKQTKNNKKKKKKKALKRRRFK